MRYRIFRNRRILKTLDDRPSFDESFQGTNPNNPVGGTLRLDGYQYQIIRFNEFASEHSFENKLNELESYWFADLEVL